MRKTIFTLFVALSLTGCSTLIPKRVELFQDKVRPFPEPAAYSQQLEKQLVQRLRQKTAQTVRAALVENSSNSVIVPAREAERLATSEAAKVGPPEKPSQLDSFDLATRLETAVAKLDTKVEDFKKGNDENAGKKIEGTGLVSIPYFAWIGGIALVVVIALFVGKLLLSAAAAANPGAAIGLNVVGAVGNIATKGFSQLIKGGEEFKDWVVKEIGDQGLQTKILDAFRVKQQAAQDQDVQNAVLAATK